MAAQPSPFDQLWRDYQSTGDERIKAELTRRFMGILVPMAKKLRAEMSGQPDLNDLISAGVVGLLEAFERFDPSRGVYFQTYCTWRVLGAMHDDQRKFDWAPSSLRIKAQRLRDAADELANKLGRPPCDAELAEALDISTAEAAELRRHAENPAPLSLDDSHAAESTLEGAALADSHFDPLRHILAAEARALLLDALKNLPDKQRYVLLLYYFEKLTMAEIGLVLDVGESRVSQLHREALETLVRRLGRRKDELLDALLHLHRRKPTA